MTTNPSTTSENRVIVALDVQSADEARTMVGELQTEAGAFKIGMQLFTAAGPEFVREVAAEHRVFLDLKFHDIPTTVAKAGIEAARLGVWMFNVHASGGAEMMRETVQALKPVCERENLVRPLVIGVTVLTSSDTNTLRETGIERTAETQVLHLACLAAKCGLDGVVASPREATAIKRAVGRAGFLVVTPGVRPDFATNDDQKRVMTPLQAMTEGSDYIVVGRPVLRDENPLAALRKIQEEIDAVEK